jgi:hypothetical protein
MKYRGPRSECVKAVPARATTTCVEPGAAGAADARMTRAGRGAMFIWFPPDSNPVVCISEMMFAAGGALFLGLAAMTWWFRDAERDVMGETTS